MKGKVINVFISFMSFLILTGCWDRQEINDIAITVGSAIDKVEDKYRITFQIPLPGQMSGVSGGGGGTSGEKSYFNDSVEGLTFRQAIQEQQESLSRRLYFAHRRVLVIGEEMARSGVDAFLDLLSRDPQNRLTAFIVVTKGEAHHLLNVDAPLERYPIEMIREMAQYAMKKPRTLKHFIEEVLTDGIDPVVPVFAVVETNPGTGGEPKTLPKMEGLAVFKQDRLVGFLNGRHSQGLLWAKGAIQNPTITIPAPKGEGYISFEFQENRTQVTPVIESGKITMQIKIQAKGTLIENESTYDVTSGGNLKIIENRLATEIKEMVQESVAALQKEYKSDPIGFGDMIYRRYPKEWRKLRVNWDQHYPNVAIEVDPLIHIEHLGTLTKPFGRKEHEIEK